MTNESKSSGTLTDIGVVVRFGESVVSELVLGLCVVCVVWFACKWLSQNVRL